MHKELGKRGIVSFVGTTEFKDGYFVGIAYDEPVGKNNGRFWALTSIDGVVYFTCPNKHGAFVRPNMVLVGDYPEIDLFDELDNMDEF